MPDRDLSRYRIMASYVLTQVNSVSCVIRGAYLVHGAVVGAGAVLLVVTTGAVVVAVTHLR